jgi:hypothetical protein
MRDSLQKPAWVEERVGGLRKRVYIQCGNPILSRECFPKGIWQGDSSQRTNSALNIHPEVENTLLALCRTGLLLISFEVHTLDAGNKLVIDGANWRGTEVHSTR